MRGLGWLRGRRPRPGQAGRWEDCWLGLEDSWAARREPALARVPEAQQLVRQGPEVRQELLGRSRCDHTWGRVR